ncbi:hypothetical protein SBBP2_60030 [Burkholderiales bacterium]|nr:hypothetical protein SBBP2_60030 [Burkholderiales bacterium]
MSPSPCAWRRPLPWCWRPARLRSPHCFRRCSRSVADPVPRARAAICSCAKRQPHALVPAPTGSFGRVYGFVYSGIDGGLAVAPLVVGRLLDHGLFRAGLLCIATMQICAVLVALRVGRSA